MTTTTLSADDVRTLCDRILDEVERAVIGKREVLRLVLAAFLCPGGHVLVEDNPGLAKTLVASSFAAVLGLDFKRIQFTPDLLPGDVTGGYAYDTARGRFELRRGPIFTHLLLADEINRASPKTQSALLEAMQEHHVTLEGTTLDLPEPFMVIATQNPIEYEGTFPLPEAQLDRFLVKISIGYPDRDQEVEVLMRRAARGVEEARLDQVCGPDGLGFLAAEAEKVHVDRDLARYAVELVRATRSAPQVAVGASPRASLALLKLARARATMEGRSYALPDDIKASAFDALIHRVILKPEVWAAETLVSDVVTRAIDSVPVPKTEAT